MPRADIACAWCGEPIFASQSRAAHLMGGAPSQRVHDHCRGAVLRICESRDLLDTVFPRFHDCQHEGTGA